MVGLCLKFTIIFPILFLEISLLQKATGKLTIGTSRIPSVNFVNINVAILKKSILEFLPISLNVQIGDHCVLAPMDKSHAQVLSVFIHLINL